MESLGIIAIILVIIGGFVVGFGNMWQFGTADKIKDLKLSDKERTELMKSSCNTEMIGFVMIGIGLLLILVVGLNS